MLHWSSTKRGQRPEHTVQWYCMRSQPILVAVVALGVLGNASELAAAEQPSGVSGSRLAVSFASGAMPATVGQGETGDRPKSGSAEQPIRPYEPDRFFRSRRDRTGRATPPSAMRLPEGFDAELLYTVPLDTQGSWVCLTADAQGRLIASAQSGGLYRITLSARSPAGGAAQGSPEAASRTNLSAPAVAVERIQLDIAGAQGLLYAFDSLYVVVNSDSGSGLYRVRDRDGDDQFDQVDLLRRFEGAGEHGPHGVVLGPEGDGLFIVGGNGCYVAQPPEATRVPGEWLEDRLHRRMGASDGAFGRNRPGGWICRTDPNGQRFELVAMGLRNPYDLAFDCDGELFTFDSDMEWDAGTPWYRPTRVNHAISGADFGWRAGTAKWPEDYFDSFGAVVDIGFSSPTGISFGTGARFPESYQRALFVGDWSLGQIYAVHLTPAGASYTAEFERFVTAAPLPVTDLVIHPSDGAMYFTVGGRGITSALYRITYRGTASTAPVLPDPEGLAVSVRDARAVRRSLERFHGGPDPAAVETAWPYLGHEDRAIRFAARVAIEHQPVSAWRDRALREPKARNQIAALAALARRGGTAQAEPIAVALERILWNELSHADRLDLLRVYMIALSRSGEMADATRRRIVDHLDPLYPSGNDRLDRELAEILTHLQAPRVIARTLELVRDAPTQELQIHYAMLLRDMARGWTPALREQYFQWFARARAHRGGVSFGGYLDQIRRDAAEPLDAPARRRLEELLQDQPETDPQAELKRRPVVMQWTVDGLLAAAEKAEHAGNAENGQQVFSAALCYRCHRFQGQGGSTGPDLTGVTRRFTWRDLIEAVVDPSRVIPDQYRSVQVAIKDGRVVTGKVADISGNTLLLRNNPFDPADLSMIDRDQIEVMEWSRTSLMPAGLLDTFTAQEIMDLLAFLGRPTETENR